MLIAIIVVVVLVLAVIYAVLYNGLVRSRNQAQEFESQISVQLKRRTDLIPNLVSTVKGYAQHEKSTLEEVVKLRNSVVSADSLQDKVTADGQLSGVLRQVFALAESYPDLKANQEFGKLMEELTNTENKVAYSRQAYNSAVQYYNTGTQTFPRNLVANLHHFQKMDYLTIPEAETKVPEVKF
ncbi:LemA family protein [Lactobacillus sp. DCY120]|uniref:LemA family protein n=1 Tax=Bombilactobacillus apium TaxID=2675299 RepID=A0A850RBU6_9LACO|nr:LemA family protein [Bombilactobacillus apium]NVY96268.1 LemA family protein [Bombilactobacillus apium]